MGNFWRGKTLVSELIWTNWRVKCDSKKEIIGRYKLVDGFLFAKFADSLTVVNDDAVNCKSVI